MENLSAFFLVTQAFAIPRKYSYQIILISCHCSYIFENIPDYVLFIAE